jgi:hypothetical protein
MSAREAWEAGRGVWKLNADRALAQDEVQIVDLEGMVLAVGTIKGISKHYDRYALEGELLLGDPRVGKPTTTPHRSRNSVGYFWPQRSARKRPGHHSPGAVSLGCSDPNPRVSG